MNEYRPIETLKEWDKNPRSITNDNFSKLKKKITRWGQFKPLLITPDGVVIGGNMRLKAYRDLGIDDIWVSVVNPKTEAEMIEIAITDNENSGVWVEQELAELLEPWKGDIELGDYEIDIKSENLEDLLQQFSPEPQEDECPEISQEEPISKLGEVYQLGRHRLMCGDSTKIENVEKLMDGKKADISFTSPPYNAGENIRGNFYENDGDNKSDEEYTSFLVITTLNALEYCKYNFVNLGLLESNKHSLIDFQSKMRDYVKDILVWNKSIAPPHINPGTFSTKWEYVFAFSKDSKSRGFPCSWQGLYPNVIETENNSGNEYANEHRAGFPVAFPLWIINKMEFAKSVIDLFMGTGTTLIACEQTNRICYGMELDPKYCDVIRKRYWKFINNNDETGWEENTPEINCS